MNPDDASPAADCAVARCVTLASDSRGTGWIISPDGETLATTTRDAPFVTIDIDLAVPAVARASYPRYVFG